MNGKIYKTILGFIRGDTEFCCVQLSVHFDLCLVKTPQPLNKFAQENLILDAEIPPN